MLHLKSFKMFHFSTYTFFFQFMMTLLGQSFEKDKNVEKNFFFHKYPFLNIVLLRKYIPPKA